MANYDITYCSRDCKNMKCIRNYEYAPNDFAISVASFDDCRSFIERRPVYEDLGGTKTNTKPTE